MGNSDTIKRVWAREILNYRGYPTVEAEVVLTDGSRGLGAVPAGISTGSSEVGQLLDGDPMRFSGRGVLRAVENVKKEIAPALKGMKASEQARIDEKLLELDGTPNKSRLGGNAILAVSLATAQAAAESREIPLYRHLGGEGPFRLPVPTLDILCGGSHAEDSVDIQEYLVIPLGFATFEEALLAGDAVYRKLAELLKAQGQSVRAGSGPLSAALGSNREGVEVIARAIEKAGYRLGAECFIGLDVAASEMFKDGEYVLAREGRTLSSQEMSDLWAEWVDAYPIVSIEDGMAEEDWEGWQALTERVGNRVQLVGDDLFTTTPDRVKEGIKLGAANAVLIKPNQIGTLTETLETIDIAQRAGWAAMMSCRSGETEDTTIADLAVLAGTGQIKAGPPCLQSISKYNRLLRIAEEMGDDAAYAGFQAYRVGKGDS